MWPERTWIRARPCRQCYAPAWRACRVCDRWVCRNHRFGHGNWIRCERCPSEALTAILRAQHQQLREDFAERREAAARAALVERLARTWPIGSLGGLPPGRGGSTVGVPPVLR